MSVAGIKTIPTSVSGGKNVIGEVWLTQNVATNTQVQITSSDPGAITVPANATITAGTDYATFTVSSFPIGSAENVTITGTLGASSKYCILTVNPPPIAGIKVLHNTSITGGGSTIGEVWFSQKLATSATVSVSSDTPGVVSSPGAVTVNGGASYSVFSLSSNPVSASTTVTLSTTFGGTTVSCALTVKPLALAGIKVNPVTVPAGTATLGEVWVAKNETSNTLVQISCGDPNTRVQSSVTIPSGKSYAYFYVYTSKASSSSAPLTATLGVSQVSCTIYTSIQVTTVQSQQLDAAGSNAAAQYATLIQTMPQAATQAQVISGLQNAPGVVQAGLSSDGQTICFQMDSGVHSCIFTDTRSTSTPQSPPHGFEQLSTQNPIIPLPAAGPSSLTVPNPGGAIIIDPFNFADYQSENQSIENLGYAPSAINWVSGNQVSLSTFSGLTAYSLILLEGHGGIDSTGKSRILIPRPAGPTTGPIDESAEPDWEAPGNGAAVIPCYGINASYIAKNNGAFSKTITILNACDSLYEPSFASAFGANPSGGGLVFGWYVETIDGICVPAANQILADFIQPDTEGQETSASHAQSDWFSQPGGNYYGSSTVCLVPNLTGSWLGTMTGSVEPNGPHDPSWGLIFSQYGPGAANVVGNFEDYPLSDVQLSNRGLQFTANLFNSPNGWNPPQFNSGVMGGVGGTMSGSIAADGSLTVQVTDGFGQTGTWVGKRQSNSSSVDISPLQLLSVTPPDGSNISAGTFDVILNCSAPLGVDGTWVMYFSNASMSAVGGNHSNPNAWDITWSVSQTDTTQPSTIQLVVGGLSDIWGNIWSPDAGTLVATWTIPATTSSNSPSHTKKNGEARAWKSISGSIQSLIPHK